MPNPLYTLVVQSLAGAVSERAANTLLQSALRDAGFSPEEVGAPQMQQVLSGPLLRRLSGVLPPEQASRELQALGARLGAQPVRQPLEVQGARSLETRNPPAEPSLFADQDDREGVGNPTDAEAGLEADDFEFDDPDYSAFQGERRSYRLESASGQEALLSDLARQPGVQGVVLCSSDGRVLRARAPRGEAQLGSIVAATALLFRRRSLKILCADLGQLKVCMRPLGGYCVAVLASGSVNIGRLITELQQLQEAA